MKKIKLMAIVPYEGLAEVVNKVAEHYADAVDTSVKVGNLQHGLVLGEQAQRDGYDVIISRGGTAELLVKNLLVPVVNIETSGYDYMRAIKLATAISGRKAIVGYSYVTNPAQSVIPLLDADICVKTVQTHDEIQPVLKKLLAEGYRLVIGDVATHRAAKELGMNAILVNSGEESVASAFDTVLWLMRSFHGLKSRAGAMERILESSPVTVAVIGQNGALNYGSRPMEEIGLSVEELSRYCSPSVQEEPRRFILKKNGWVYNIDAAWDEDAIGGAGYIFQILDHRLDSGELHGVEIRSFLASMQGVAELFKLSGLYPSETVEEAIRLSASPSPLAITGRAGIGKYQLAECIHRYGERWQLPFVCFDCGDIDPADALDKLKPNEEGSALRDGATLCFKNVDRLCPEQQYSLYTRLTEFSPGKWRLIATSCRSMTEEGGADKYLAELFGLRLHIPTIKYTAKDMERFVNLNIAEFNSSCGKQIVGLTPDAMELLLSCSWESDFEGLRQTVGQLVLMAKSPYIFAEEVKRTIENRNPTPTERELRLNGTLAEIELEVINRVLKEERGNLSKTAARLGIGRSTLWRKLGRAEKEQNKD